MNRFLLPVFCLASTAFGAPLDPLFTRPDLWNSSPDGFSQLAEARQYVWTSSLHDSARAAGREMTVFEMPVIESIARFDKGKLAQITATLYARGDAGDLTREQFESLLQSATETLNKVTKTKPTERGKDASSAVHAEGRIWQTSATQYLLEYSFTREIKSRDVPFRAEFLRLTLSPPPRATNLLASISTGAPAKFNGLSHVKRNLSTGDVLLPDVPMVDQGQKGYCAVACTERVMRYYGIPVDENELAQVANTATAGGTSPDAMFAALKKLVARLRVRIRPLEQMDVKQLLDLQNDYNRVARHEGANPLPDQGHVIDINGMFISMKPELLLETRTKNKSETGRFERAVEDHIDQGLPLLWSVVVGIFPEKGIPQGGGGHMRLIIGYNNKTQEILYSDSWGAGHELKRMPLTQAVSMTVGLTSIEPI